MTPDDFRIEPTCTVYGVLFGLHDPDPRHATPCHFAGWFETEELAIKVGREIVARGGSSRFRIIEGRERFN